MNKGSFLYIKKYTIQSVHILYDNIIFSVKYRVFPQIADLGWFDFDFGSSIGFWQNRLARWWDIKSKVNPTRVRMMMDHPSVSNFLHSPIISATYSELRETMGSRLCDPASGRGASSSNLWSFLLGSPVCRDCSSAFGTFQGQSAS